MVTSKKVSATRCARASKIKIKIASFMMKYSFLNKILYSFSVSKFPGSNQYWESRYASGGTSGDGSYGKLAEFKAEIINSIIINEKIQSVIDFGCGDGYQLAYFSIPKYIGLDVSKNAIKKCIKKFEGDKSKSFFLYDSKCFIDRNNIFLSELALSLDVIYHLIEDDVFQIYMKDLFSSSSKLVVIYSSNFEDKRELSATHIRHRNFSKYIERNFPNWKLIEIKKNRFPEKSFSDFYIYSCLSCARGGGSL